MIIKDADLINFICAHYPLDPYIFYNGDAWKSRKPETLELNITQTLLQLKTSMFARDFTAEELAKFITNENNPKTMDYFFMKLLNVKVEEFRINYTGNLSGTVKSKKARITESFGVLQRVRAFDRGQIYFVLDIHEHQIFPKSRSFKICSRRTLPVGIANPNAGQTKKITYGGGYVSTYLEPSELFLAKQLVLYCRNAWERKGEVKPSRSKTEEATAVEVTATDAAVSVI
jgi:hypothetical protein